MKYYHEFDTEKDEALYPEYRCGYYFDDEWVNEDDLTKEQERLVAEQDLQPEEGYFLCSDDLYGAAYGPCTYDEERDVYVNCDGFEIRNEDYEENEENEENEVEETLEERVKRLEEKVKELESRLG